MTDAPLSLREIADLIARMPRRPRWELHIHPSVMAPIREHAKPPPDWWSFAGSGLLFSGIPVIEHEDYAEGEWRLYKDDVIDDLGFITNLKETP